MKSVFLGLILIISCSQISCKKLVIDTYSESLCPSCTNFMSYSLKKALETPGIEKILEINFYPYGNAEQVQLSDGSWQFTCQHGHAECYGNMLQACSMNNIPDKQTQLKYVTCVQQGTKSVTQESIDQANEKCAKQFGLDVTSIHECMKSDFGNQLMHDIADQTHALDPPNDSVPWFVVNGKYDEEHSAEIEFNLVSWACKNYEGHEKVEACDKYMLLPNLLNRQSLIQSKIRYSKLQFGKCMREDFHH